jgi:hypothetical protein
VISDRAVSESNIQVWGSLAIFALSHAFGRLFSVETEVVELCWIKCFDSGKASSDKF